MSRRRCWWAVAVVVAVLGTSCSPGDAGSGAGGADGAGGGITVAAASDLRPAAEELAELFTARTGTGVTFSFGSSGLLREQVRNGAPFDLFAAADESFVDAVLDAGIGDPATRAVYAEGRLALWARPGRRVPATVADLADTRYARVAVANPEHAPYGRAAVEALAAAGVADDVGPRLVYGENVADALRLARSGNADVGIVALSLVVADGTPHEVVPADLHRPLRQALVVTGTGDRGAAATELAELFASTEGRRVLARHGFDPPGDPAPPS